MGRPDDVSICTSGSADWPRLLLHPVSSVETWDTIENLLESRRSDFPINFVGHQTTRTPNTVSLVAPVL